VLYFSSDAKQGLGAMDVYKIDLTTNSAAKNLGKPVNSEKDDFAFTINENKNIAFVASNRNGNDDIFKLIPICNYEVNAIVTNANSGAILAEANVSILDDKNNIISSLKSNSKGEVSYTVECEKAYTIQAIKDGFESNSFAVTASKKKGGSIKIDVALKPISEIITEKQVNLKPIFFEYNNSNITQQGAFELDKLVQIMKNNEKLFIFVKSHTDNRGSDEFNLLLSDKRVKATIQYVISNGIDPNRISGKGFGETEPKVDCKENCTEEAHEQNRRSEFLIVK
jgi:outer membrane protein OmpA-like peptidoglycan-associated protein